MIPGGLPPLNLSLANDSKALGGEATQGFNSDAGSMNINYGSGVSQSGDGLPVVAVYAALAIAGFFVLKKFG